MTPLGRRVGGPERPRHRALGGRDTAPDDPEIDEIVDLPVALGTHHGDDRLDRMERAGQDAESRGPRSGLGGLLSGSR
jgi:hypothetical protein